MAHLSKGEPIDIGSLRQNIAVTSQSAAKIIDSDKEDIQRSTMLCGFDILRPCDREPLSVNLTTQQKHSDPRETHGATGSSNPIHPTTSSLWKNTR